MISSQQRLNCHVGTIDCLSQDIRSHLTVERGTTAPKLLKDFSYRRLDIHHHFLQSVLLPFDLRNPRYQLQKLRLPNDGITGKVGRISCDGNDRAC